MMQWGRAYRTAAALLLAAACAVPACAEPAVDVFFTDKALAETRAIVVMQGGKIVAERYAPGYGPDSRFISWSMAKSVTSTLVGQLVGAGKLKLDEPAPIPAWHRDPADPRGKITLEQMIHMSSGLRHAEATPVETADTNRGLFGDKSADTMAYAQSQPLVAASGSTYVYSTLTSTMLAGIVQRTVSPDAKTPAARRSAMQAYMQTALISPAGLDSLICEFDAAGTMLGGSFCHATARDWARFGQMYLDGGEVGGRQVVPPEWVRWVQVPAATDGGYGGQFWLNRARPAGREAALFPEMGPGDAYAAVGHLGQYVIIVPSKHLVVVRLGKTQDNVLGPVRPALGRLVNAYPDRP